MAPVIRHKQRFNRSNAMGGPGSPQAYDEAHEIEGLWDVSDIAGLPDVLAEHGSVLASQESALAEEAAARSEGDDAAVAAIAPAINDQAEAAKFTPPGAGAVVRSLREKLRGIGALEDHDTAQHAVEARRNVEGSAGATYALTGIALGNAASFDGKGAVVTATAGTSLFTLSAYASRLGRFYIADNRLSADCAIHVEAGRYVDIREIRSPNTGAGGVKFAPTSGFIALAELNSLTFEGVTGYGISIGSSVVEIRAAHIYCAGKIEHDVDGKGRPMAGTVGWRQNTPIVGGNDVGGHQIAGSNMIGVDTGWWLTDASLTTYNDCIGDSTRGYALVIDGNSHGLVFNTFFAGTTMGILVKDTAQDILFDGLRTKSIGQIPPWGQNPFYNSAGPYYAVTLQGSAKVTINGNNWVGDKRVSVAPGAKLSVSGGHWFKGRNTADLAAGSTAYLADKDFAAQTDALFRAPHDGYLFLAKATSTVAPGAGKTITFTVQVDGVDTAMVFTISDSAFGAETYGPIHILKDHYVTLKVEKEPGAALGGRYNFDVQMLGL